MPGFYDTTCPRCKKRYGWQGDAYDNPGCARCGWMPSAAELKENARVEAELTADLLAAADPASYEPDSVTAAELQRQADDRLRQQLRDARLAVGLSPVDVFELTGIRPALIEMIEDGRRPLVPRQVEKLWDLYNLPY